jgi:dephospho-CoA kinase
MIAGLTGGIGSGKSVVAKLFELLGCAVFNSDQVAKQLYFEPAIKEQVLLVLGANAYLDDMHLNKTYISSKIFSDQALLKKINAIIHPAVVQKFTQFAAVNANRIVIKESALLYEANLLAGIDKMMVVVADDALRVKRVMAREDITEAMVLSKIKMQQPQEEKARKADFVIRNNEREFLILQVLRIHEQLLDGAITDN